MKTEEIIEIMDIDPVNISYSFAQAINEEYKQGLSKVVQGIVDKEILVTDDRLMFAQLLYRISLDKLFGKDSTQGQNVSQAHQLAWFEFVFKKNENSVIVHYDADEEKYYYAYITTKGGLL